MPLVSVLLPCRDEAEFLPEAIASLEAQSFQDFEVIAVDDGSTDNTRALLDAWAARDDRVHVSPVISRGVVAALAAGAARAHGVLIAVMNADDVASPERLEAQVALLSDRSEIAACGTRVRYFPRGRVRGGARRYERWLNGRIEPDSIARHIFVECPVAQPALMIRKKAFDAVGGYLDPGWPEDYDLILRLWAAGYSMANVPRVLLQWREHGSRISRSSPRYSAAAFRRCKVHYLRRTLLCRRDGAVVWGAGSVGKRFARELQAQDVAVRAFVELDPRKIGQSIHGAPVVAPDGIERYRGALVLAAVGSPGARSEIRADLAGRGWREMEDFCAVA